MSAPSDQSLLPSSPPRSNKDMTSPPSTPTRFAALFTPRTRSNKEPRQLRDITHNAVNHNKQTPTPSDNLAHPSPPSSENASTPTLRGNKKRKGLLSPEASPTKKARTYGSSAVFEIAGDDEIASEVGTTNVEDDGEAASDAETGVPETTCKQNDNRSEDEKIYPRPVRLTRLSDFAGRLLCRSFGGPHRIGRGVIRDCYADWRDSAADFYHHPKDLYTGCEAVPYCTTGFNDDPTVVVGDEAGTITFLNPNKSFEGAETKVNLHSNAIFDLALSPDDTRLATASGDQTSRVIDCNTKKTVRVLCGSHSRHESSIKQVRFQPGSRDIVATSGRDGAVMIWDLRCTGSQGTIGNRVSFDGTPAEQQENRIPPWRTIHGAHYPKPRGRSSADALRTQHSVTAVAFLNSSGREHMLLTGSEAATTVKLWDIRRLTSARTSPLTITRPPESHGKRRSFGIGSISLDSQGSRLYVLSTDRRIYTYSMRQLILNDTPESNGPSPLYAFSHHSIRASGNFWIRASVRQATRYVDELLAVGSSSGFPVLFTTDEDLLKRTRASAASGPSSNESTLAESNTIPIYEHGIKLAPGHGPKYAATAVAWSMTGKLITTGDDLTVRCWHQDHQAARDLRLGGKASGRRRYCGWADVGPDYDDDDDVKSDKSR